MIRDWSITRPADWIDRVNEPISRRELERLELSERREQPHGDEAWTSRTIKKFGLHHTVRREGRPKKQRPAAANN